MKTRPLVFFALCVTVNAADTSESDPEPLNGRYSTSLGYPNELEAARRTVQRLTEIDEKLGRILRNLEPRRVIVPPALPDNRPEHIKAAEAWLAQTFSREGNFWRTLEQQPGKWLAWQLAGVEIATSSCELDAADKLNGAEERFTARFTASAVRGEQDSRWRPVAGVWSRDFTRKQSQWKGWGAAPFIRNAAKEQPDAAQNARSPSEESKRMLDALDKMFLRRETDWFSVTKDDGLVQYRLPSLQLEQGSLSEVDKLNGRERAFAANLIVQARRVFTDGKWGEWLPAGGFHSICSVQKTKGEWSVTLSEQATKERRAARPEELPPDVAK